MTTRVTMIGERINPTGHKKLAQALKERDFRYVRELAARPAAADRAHPGCEHRRAATCCWGGTRTASATSLTCGAFRRRSPHSVTPRMRAFLA